jgi:ADP-heptose:LPS heptosyltransferase
MNISVRLEGGAGDCLLGHRFAAAIKEKYKNAEITAYIDSQGKTFQRDVLNYLFPTFYKEIKIIENKKYSNFWVDCQFGIDNYYGALENVPDDILEEMQSYDKFYDLHIDSLKWTNYDFDWYRYYRFFPKPEIQPKNDFGDYIVMHLVSSSSDGHRLEDWYIDKLIELISAKNKCILISTNDTNKFYENVSNLDNVEVFNGCIENACDIIANAKAMVATDSGFRYVGYSFGVPTITFSKHSPQAYSAIPSHQIRWLVYPETCFPLNYDAKKITEITNKIVSEDSGYILAPYLQNFEMQAIRRKYSVNKEKTK